MYSRNYSLSWLPLHHKQIEESQFPQFTPIQQAYYLLLMKEFNTRQGEFYKADLEFQAELDCSLSSIRKARRKFMDLGWIKAEVGKQADGKNLATTYKDVKWSRPEKNEEGNTRYFVAFDKYALEVLTNRVRNNDFKIKDIMTYVVLWYWYGAKKFFDEQEAVSEVHNNELNQPLDVIEGMSSTDLKVYISKSHLSRLTGLSIEQAVESVERLYNNYQFTSGSHLFEFNDEYHQLSIYDWSTFSNPGKDSNNSGLADKYRYEVKQKAKELREEREMKSSSKKDNVISINS